MDQALPTKEQIASITDIDALFGIKDEVEKRTLHIETQLEFSNRDDAWASSAQNALALHRFVDRQLCRRIERLKAIRDKESKGAAIRPEESIHPLTLEVIKAPPTINLSAFSNPAQIDEKVPWLIERIIAVQQDRKEEIGLDANERDERFMSATGAALSNLKMIRAQLQNRRGELTRAAKAEAQKAHDAGRQQAFIDAAKTVLDRETYLRIWRVAEAMNPFAKALLVQNPPISPEPDHG